MGWIIVFAIITLIAVFLLKGFDRIAGRGPKQVRDGINQSSIGQKEDEGRVPCPYCAELIIPTAKKCRYCKSILTDK